MKNNTKIFYGEFIGSCFLVIILLYELVAYQLYITLILFYLLIYWPLLSFIYKYSNGTVARKEFWKFFIPITNDALPVSFVVAEFGSVSGSNMDSPVSRSTHWQAEDYDEE